MLASVGLVCRPVAVVTHTLGSLQISIPMREVLCRHTVETNYSFYVSLRPPNEAQERNGRSLVNAVPV